MSRQDQALALAAMREVLAASPVALLVVDPDGRIALANPAVERLFGYTSDELVGRPLVSLVPEPPAIGTAEAAAPTVSVTRGGAGAAGSVRRARRKDGAVLAVSVVLTPCAARGAGATIAAIADDGEPARLTAELERARWMSTVGDLTLGLAHELSGPLASVTLNVEVVRASLVRHREAWSGEPWALDLVPALEDALLGVEEARRTVAALREVARPASDADTSEVARAVELALTMTRHRVRARGRVEVALTDTPPLAIDPARLAQVLVLAIDAAALALDPAHMRDNVIRITTGVAAAAAWIDVAGPGAARTIADGSGLAAARALLAPVGATLALDGGPGAVRVRITVPEAPDLD